MKKHFFYFGLIIFIYACNKTQKNVVSPAITTEQDSVTNFFPVTNFINGQLLEIQKGFSNPLKIVTENKHIDSSWLKMEDIKNELAVFLNPVIDTANLIQLFTEKKFLDQTLNAYTFTYDCKSVLPDSNYWQHWDIYVDPENNRVKRIYLVKRTTVNSELQLIWQTDEYAKIVSLKTAADGNINVEKEVLIKWKF